MPKAPPKRPKPTKPHTIADLPAFGQPQPGPEPSGFKVPHPSDNTLYGLTDRKLVEPFPAPRGGVEPVLTLAEVWGPALGPAKVQAIAAAGQIAFHSVGDTGSVKGPASESIVADAAQADLAGSPAKAVPAFFFHLGDVVYSFGEAQYYYDQFYAPWRTYQAPILGLAGNHDGVVYRTDPAPTLDAWLQNFCATAPVMTPEAGGLIRTAMTQPGAFYTFDAPFVRILAVYSNVLEDPGVLSTEGGKRPTLNDSQVAFLTAALTRCKAEKYAGAVVIAVHHPPYTAGNTHGGSPRMLEDLDAAATAADFWPHAVFSGHAHNYQRFTRTLNPGTSGETNVAYLVAGCGGHGLDGIRKLNGVAIRVPYIVDNTLTLENYEGTHYGFLRVTVDPVTLRIEYHQVGGTATPVDVVLVNLQTRIVS
jgi:hypothetical protein